MTAKRTTVGGWIMRIVLLALLFALPLGCKKQAATAPTAVAPATGGGGNTNYVAGGGAVQNVRQAARRTITLADMSTLGTLLEIEFNTANKMPSYDTFKATLTKDAPNILAAINDGSIILCWTTNHEGIWAYEIEADVKGGVALVTGRASRYDATAVKQMLGR